MKINDNECGMCHMPVAEDEYHIFAQGLSESACISQKKVPAQFMYKPTGESKPSFPDEKLKEDWYLRWNQESECWISEKKT